MRWETLYFVDTWKRDITRIEGKQRLDLASRTMKKSWRNETAKYTRNKWHSSRNVICCPRKTIVRDRPVARDGREGVSVRADLERILAGNGQDPRKYQGFLRGARGRGNNFNHSRRTALMFYKDIYAFLRSVESQFVLGNRTLFFRSRSHPVASIFPGVLSVRVEVVFVRVYSCPRAHATVFFRLYVVWESRKYRRPASGRNRDTGIASIWLCFEAEANNGDSMSLYLSLSIYLSVSPVSDDYVQIFIC